jgi:hypothetical protein
LTFEHARFLHQGSFVMYDRETISLWLHTTGEAVVGEHLGRTLEFLPSSVTTWKKWRAEHPETFVLNVKQVTGPRFQVREKPELGGLSVGRPDDTLKLYPLPILQKQRVINDKLGRKEIVVFFNPDEWAFAAFERGGRTFAWKDDRIVDQSGREWNLLKGTSGELALTPVPAVTWLTSYWKRFYPEGDVYKSNLR